MTARIYRPAKTAMQSGSAKTREWVLDYEPEEPRVVESLMGWTTSGDMKSQLRLRFATKEEAPRVAAEWMVAGGVSPTRMASAGVRRPIHGLGVSAQSQMSHGP